MSGETILLVDDNQQLLGVSAQVLETRGYRPVPATDTDEARMHLEQGSFPLVLLDIDLPEESGLSLLRELASHKPEIATVMVTGYDDPDLADEAIELGAYGYVIKPFEPSELLINVANVLKRRTLELENRAHRERLEEIVSERTASLHEAIAHLERSGVEIRRAHEETVRRLARALEFRDEETGLHIERMSFYCAFVAEKLGLEDERCELIRSASALHDIGKISVPDWILAKPGPLTQKERAIMESHAEAGHELLAGSRSQLLALAETIAWTHHERFDGGGYPRRLAGEQIPLEGRIATVADAFDAMTSDRPYRVALSVEEALARMRAGRGTQFDPDILGVFLATCEEMIALAVHRHFRALAVI